ncbi:PLAC8 family protein [Colletotrichum tofieldiae]|uniref:PLAC8 family protein n=1 Tax=Colletotrichum tofieldiae TaxID=708197 RepID=A0A166W3G9_9PEZI|nr:PLAC8 family protein [Colletotrichum tofieldiae]
MAMTPHKHRHMPFKTYMANAIQTRVIDGTTACVDVALHANCVCWAPSYPVFTSHRIEDPSMENYNHINGDCILMMGVTYLTGFGWMYGINLFIVFGEVKNSTADERSNTGLSCASVSRFASATVSKGPTQETVVRLIGASLRLWFNMKERCLLARPQHQSHKVTRSNLR